MKAKVNKVKSNQVTETDRVVRHCDKLVKVFANDCKDPFANVNITRVFTAQALEADKRRRDATQEVKTEKDGGAELGLGCTLLGTAPVPRKATPSFQLVERNPRSLLNPADRMVNSKLHTTTNYFIN